MSSLKKNLAYNIIYQILLIILPLITAPYVSRVMGSKAVGIYSYTYSVAYYFILVATLGIANYGTRSIAKSRDDKDRLSQTFSSIYMLQFIMFSIAIIFYIIYLITFKIDYPTIAIIQTIYILAGMLDISWLFFGLEKFKITVTRNILIKILTIITMFICVHSANDLWKYTLIMAVGTFFSQSYLWIIRKKYVVFKKVCFKEIFFHFKDVLILFIPVFAYSIYKVMDKIMLGNMSGYEEVGYYNNAERIINIPLGIITAIGTVMLSRLSNLVSTGKNDEIERFVHLFIEIVTIMSAAISCGLMAISYVFTPVFFGKGFEPCTQLIQLLSITIFFISWANVIRTQYLIPHKLDKIYVISTLTGALVNLIINLLLIPRLNGIGAAIGTIMAEATVMLIQAFSIKRRINVFKDIFRCIPYIVFGVLMLIVVNKIGLLLGNKVLTLLVQVGSGAIIYMILTISYMKISKDELGNLVFSIIHDEINKLKVAFAKKS